MSSAPSQKPDAPLRPHDALPSASALARRPAGDAVDGGTLPVEQRSLVMRLSEEVAALRRALDASHHRIAALEIEAAEDLASGLLNRRAFLREIDRAIAFQARYHMVCGVALIDVIGIGAISAAEGHSAANAALRTIGNRIRENIRSCDIGARSDSEQFGIVLWNSAHGECASRIEGLCRAIGSVEFPGPIESRAAIVMIEPGVLSEELLERLDCALAATALPPFRR